MISTPRCLFPLLALLGVLPVACQQARETDRPSGETNLNRNIRFGMPGPATPDAADREAYLLEREQYVLSYNGKTRTPNWVSWALRKDDLGKAKRGPFEPDPLLPKSFAHITSHVYDGSGFDRGHMCPAQDRSSTQADMDATFCMTNIVPQAPNCNQRGWERLESYCREQAREGHVLYIASGPHGAGGTGKDGFKKEIGKGRTDVTVPAKIWKVIMVLPEEKAEPFRRTRTIAVIFPNDQKVDYDWPKYRCSVADVEKLTGLKFWPALPAELALALKEKVDEVKVHVPHPRRESD
jgi:endonuclease G